MPSCLPAGPPHKPVPAAGAPSRPPSQDRQSDQNPCGGAERQAEHDAARRAIPFIAMRVIPSLVVPSLVTPKLALVQANPQIVIRHLALARSHVGADQHEAISQPLDTPAHWGSPHKGRLASVRSCTMSHICRGLHLRLNQTRGGRNRIRTGSTDPSPAQGTEVSCKPALVRQPGGLEAALAVLNAVPQAQPAMTGPAWPLKTFRSQPSWRAWGEAAPASRARPPPPSGPRPGPATHRPDGPGRRHAPGRC